MANTVIPSLATPRAVLEALVTFLTANGWTLVFSETPSSTTMNVCVRIPGVTDYIWISASSQDLVLRTAIGYTPGVSIVQQPNVSPGNAITNRLAAGNFPRTWFFAEGSEVDVVILRSDSPAYAHLAFGALQKYGDYVGGTYADGSYWRAPGPTISGWDQGSDHALFGYGVLNSGYLRADCVEDGRSNFYHPLSQQTTEAGGGAITGIAPLGRSSMYDDSLSLPTSPTNLLPRLVFAADNNVFSGRHFFHPIEPWVRRTGAGAYFSPAGYFKNRRFCSLVDYDPEQEVTVAGETWKLFPVLRKQAMDTLGYPTTGDAGFAIRVVP